MPGLVEELQRAATDPTVSIGDLLRKAKLVASKLKQKATAQWIDAELSGNFAEIEFPEYRRVPVIAMQYHPMHGTFLLVTSDAGLNETLNAAVRVPRPAREIEQLANGEDDKIFMSVPPGVVESLRELGADVFAVRRLTSRAAFAALLDGIRTRVIDWSLELENNGVVGEGMSFSDEEKKRASAITFTMNGGNFAGVVGDSHDVGVQHVSQYLMPILERARNLAERLSEQSHDLDEDDRTIVATVADKIKGASDKPTLENALRFAKSAISKLTGFVARSATEHEIGELLNMFPT
jgi:hypothetical protein